MPRAPHEVSAGPATGQVRSGRLAGKFLLGVGLAGLFGYLFLRGADLSQIGRALTGVNPYLYGLALVVATTGFALRALRWRRYLLPIKVVEHRAVFEILAIGYFVSNFVPGRLGDFVVRPGMMSRSEGIAAASALATIAVERLFDLFTVVVLFALYLALLAPSDLGGAIDLTVARYVGWFLLLGCAYGVRLLVGLRVERERCIALVERLIRPLPDRWQRFVSSQVRGFAEGLNLFEDLANALWTIGYTVAAWMTVAVSMWLTTRAIGIESVRPVDALFLVGLGVVGVAIPAPGGVGSFHWIIAAGLVALGVQVNETAQAAAILLWSLGFLPMTVLGGVAIIRRGVGWAEFQGELS